MRAEAAVGRQGRRGGGAHPAATPPLTSFLHFRETFRLAAHLDQVRQAGGEARARCDCPQSFLSLVEPLFLRKAPGPGGAGRRGRLERGARPAAAPAPHRCRPPPGAPPRPPAAAPAPRPPARTALSWLRIVRGRAVRAFHNPVYVVFSMRPAAAPAPRLPARTAPSWLHGARHLVEAD